MPPLPQEAPGDVRFLLVHHTASPNGYARGDVPALLQGFHRFHTGPERGWPDIAYNFLVDAFGDVWEGRSGSLTGPVQGSATGGSQGFAQLCCFIGDFRTAAPTPAAEASMKALLARLSEVYGVDTSPGARVSFTSRGSNRHPAGTTVTTSTIATHRQMSLTECPGDRVHEAVLTRYPQEVTALRAATAARSVPHALGGPTPEPAGSTPSALPGRPVSATPSARTTVSPTSTASRAAVPGGTLPSGEATGTTDGSDIAPWAAAGGAAALVTAVVGGRRHVAGARGAATGTPLTSAHPDQETRT